MRSQPTTLRKRSPRKQWQFVPRRPLETTASSTTSPTFTRKGGLRSALFLLQEAQTSLRRRSAAFGNQSPHLRIPAIPIPSEVATGEQFEILLRFRLQRVRRNPGDCQQRRQRDAIR